MTDCSKQRRACLIHYNVLLIYFQELAGICLFFCSVKGTGCLCSEFLCGITIQPANKRIKCFQQEYL